MQFASRNSIDVTGSEVTPSSRRTLEAQPRYAKRPGEWRKGAAKDLSPACCRMGRGVTLIVIEYYSFYVTQPLDVVSVVAAAIARIWILMLLRGEAAGMQSFVEYSSIPCRPRPPLLEPLTTPVEPVAFSDTSCHSQSLVANLATTDLSEFPANEGEWNAPAA